MGKHTAPEPSEVLTATGIAYRRQGSGQPLLLVHGIGSSRHVWNPLLPLLTDRFDVIAIDLPGFGDSAKDADGTVSALTARVADFVAALGLQRPWIAGNSMGGAIALELARVGLVGDVIAFAPIGFWNKPELLANRTLLNSLRLAASTTFGLGRFVWGTTVGAPVAISLYGNPLNVPARQKREEFNRLRDCTGWRTALNSFADYSFRSDAILDAHRIRVAWGSRDVVLTYPTQSRRARNRLPNATHITLKGAGHLPFWDATQECVAAIDG